MDYKKIMDDKVISFNEIYEEAMNQFCMIYLTNPTVVTKLKEKREFGLKKYGDHSFQSSFENAMSSPVLEQAEEETIDMMNYILHKMFVQNIKGGKDFLDYVNLLKKINEIYLIISEKRKREESKNGNI